MKRLALTFFPALIVAACSTSHPPAAAPAPQPAPVVQSAAPAPAPAAKPVAVKSESPMEAFQRDQYAMDRDSVFFDYDKAAIKPDEESVIAQHAKVLEKYPQDHLTLQGNCDERGSSEYNLALGQRRADAVKHRLVLLGIPSERIETVSFGKEKPRETCHQETCWSENRRADFVDAWKQQVTSR